MGHDKMVRNSLPACPMLCRGAFIPFLVAGDPDPATSLEALQLLDEVGLLPYVLPWWWMHQPYEGLLNERRALNQPGAFALGPCLIAVVGLFACLQIGADVIELGVPCPHPSADGPTIQAADARALQAGTNLEQVSQGRSSRQVRVKAKQERE